MSTDSSSSSTGTKPPARAAQPPTVPPEATKRCIQCAHEIPADAKKCKDCSSYQNWRRHLTLGQNLLTLVLAVLTVLGILGPFVLKLVERFQVTVVAHEIAGGSVPGQETIERFVFFSNPGTKPAFVVSAKLRLVDEQGKALRDSQGQTLWLAQFPADWKEPKVIPAGEQTIEKFSFSRKDSRIPRDRPSRATAMEVAVVNASGSIQKLPLKKVSTTTLDLPASSAPAAPAEPEPAAGSSADGP